MKIVVYTCILSGFDNLHAPEVSSGDDVRYICYTNIPHLPPVSPWEYRPAYAPLPHMGRNSRIPKILPHLFFDADYSIWHDGCFSLRKRPEDIIAQTLEHSYTDLAAHVHPSVRTCLYEEASLCIEAGIGEADEIKRQALTYKLKGHPEKSGLWACGMLVRKHTDAMKAFNEAWWKNYAAGGSRDQISFPFSLRETGMPIHTINADVWSGPFMRFHWHDAFKGRGDVDSFAEERAGMRMKLDRLRELTGDVPQVRIP